MDLITKSFKKTTNAQDAPEPQSSSQDVQEDVNTNTPEYSSQDATLLEVRDQALGATTASSSKSRKKKGNKNLSKRGVPMREEFFSKIGWTRSFISDPADPLHNPHMVWCHICKKNFQSSLKVPMRYSDTTGRSAICDETSTGAMNTVEVLTQLPGRRSTGSEAAMGSFLPRLNLLKNCPNSRTLSLWT